MRPRSTLLARALAPALALAYALLYMQCYVSFLYFYFNYIGYDLLERDPLFMLVSLTITVAPVLCYRGLRALSSAIAVLTYLVLYVPIVLTFALGSVQPVEKIHVIQLTFMAGMSLLFLADTLPVRNPFRFQVGVDLMPLVLAATALGTAYILFVYRGSLNFASFGEDLYAQRAANEALGADLLTRYLSSWLSTVLVPLCLAFGLRYGRHRYTIGGVVACLVMYMAAANKLVILFPFIYGGFYLLMRRRLPSMFPVMSVALGVLIAVMMSIASLGTVPLLAAAIVLNRTIGNGGQLTVAYYDFFSFYAQTGYSHVHGLNLLTRPYPYGDLILGQVVGQFYWSPFVNANANFWATDGIAAIGLPGVAIISVVTMLLFVAMNAVTQRHDRLFVILCFLPFVTTLLNQSLFSSFWSGGALFLMIFFAISRTAADASPGRPAAVPARGAVPAWS